MKEKLYTSKIIFLKEKNKVHLFLKKELWFVDDFKVVDTKKELLSLIKRDNYSLIILDMKAKLSEEENLELKVFLNSLSNLVPNVPKLILYKKLDTLIDKTNDIFNDYHSFVSKPLRKLDIKRSILLALFKKREKVYFQDGIYYHKTLKSFFYKNNELIYFTKYEKYFLESMVCRDQKMLDYDRCEYTKMTIRNLVHKIRLKTYYSFLQNTSSQGYFLDCNKFDY